MEGPEQGEAAADILPGDCPPLPRDVSQSGKSSLTLAYKTPAEASTFRKEVSPGGSEDLIGIKIIGKCYNWDLSHFGKSKAFWYISFWSVACHAHLIPSVASRWPLSPFRQ